MFCGVWGDIERYGHQHFTVGGRESPGVHMTTHAYIDSYSPPIAPHTPPNIPISLIQRVWMFIDVLGCLYAVVLSYR